MTTKNVSGPQHGPLHGVRVLDLSRVLAGPACTQILGDMGADIIKIERPGEGDDTRKWGPPYLKDENGADTSESAYYLCANRNKRSIAVDLSSEAGRALIDQLLDHCDILIENFKVGSLKKLGLDYETVSARHPHIVYCSITGFGQTGPLASEPGYDFLAQAFSGLMGATGEKTGEPMKVGVALSDVMTGLYAAIGILAALRHRDLTGAGQHVDLALLDVTIAGMTNLAQYYLTSGQVASRQGNAHATIVPYQCFRSADGHVVVAVGNDTQFRRFAKILGHGEWADDKNFATNRARVEHREQLIPMIEVALAAHPTAHWVALLQEADVPVAPVNNIAQTFAMDQVQARGMAIEMDHPLSPEPVHLVGSPLKFSGTPVTYRAAPPQCGEQTEHILQEILNMDAAEIAKLKKAGIVA